MQLVINGKPDEVNGVETMRDLLGALALSRQRVAVEVNGELVTRGSYADTALNDGDRVEIVTFVGGG